MHAGRDGVDDDQHHRGELVDAQRPLHVQSAALDPGHQLDGARMTAHGDVEEQDPGQDRRDQHGTRGHELRDAVADGRRAGNDMVVVVGVVVRVIQLVVRDVVGMIVMGVGDLGVPVIVMAMTVASVTRSRRLGLRPAEQRDRSGDEERQERKEYD